MTDDTTEARPRPAEITTRGAADAFALLLQSVEGYAIFLLDPSGRIASWNPGAERLKGYREEEVLGEHFSKFYLAEDVAAGKPEAELTTALRDGRAEEQGWRVRKDGSLFWADVVVTPVRDASGELRGYAKVTRDLTERKRAEEDRLKLARAEAELRLQEEFLLIASHELRTPLGALRFNVGALDLLQKREYPDDARLGRAVETAKAQVKRIGALVDRLLDVSRISTGRLAIMPEDVDAVALVRQVVGEFRASAGHEGSSIELELPEGPVPAHWDGLRIEQAIGNLLANAIKYGRGKPIRVELVAGRGVASIAVEDSGIGIAADVLARIFERFERGVAAREFSGLGVGLYVARHLVEAHDGEIEVSSTPGCGSTFRVRLPLAGPAAMGNDQSKGAPVE